MKIKIYTCLSVALFCANVFGGELTQKSEPLPKNASSSSEEEATIFSGCIDFKVSHSIRKGESLDDQEKLDLVLDTMLQNYGSSQSLCHSSSGDWVLIFNDSSRLNKIWYFSKSNIEYTFFKSGVLRYEVQDKVVPTGFPDNNLISVEKTNPRKGMGMNLSGITVVFEDGSKDKYWSSANLLLNKNSYQYKKLSYYNKVMEKIQGVPLITEHILPFGYTRTRAAIKVTQKSPSIDLFKLPKVEALEWPKFTQ
ncbi:MAG: hypothetical protein HRT53_08275 [Colwellia sp.]|nr:hypothetical protein [Colwellia sp.]